MPRLSGKKKSGAPRKKKKTEAPASPPLNPLRAGMPAQDSITDVKEYPVGKKVYRIIQTDEVDEYEKPAPSKRKRRRKR
jgi:hypothetical protein